MKLFLKILFFIFTMIIITIGEVKSSTVVTILREETSYSFFQKSHTAVKASEAVKALKTETIITKLKNIGKPALAEKIEAMTVEGIAKGGSRIEDLISKRVVKTITNYDSKLGQVVEYPKYNNVALGKSSYGALEQFGKEVGANVWTTETKTIFTKMYDLPDSWTFERSMTSVFNETVGTNQGKILFDIKGVEIQKSVSGGLVHTLDLVFKGNVTELELQMILRNKSWYDIGHF